MYKFFILGIFIGFIFAYLLLIPYIYISFKNKIILQNKIKLLENLEKDKFIDNI
jgi:hypothetical protein